MSVDVSYDPRTGHAAATITNTSPQELDAAISRASDAASQVASAAPQERKRWLYAAAQALEANRYELARLADWETALGMTRLEGEVTRTAGQIRFYADVAQEGGFLRATIDERTASTPAICRVGMPLGPVAVFGASNFPFAFSVFGNDTASAIAAGCPAVVKSHPAHPTVSLRVFELAREALIHEGAPEGILELVSGFDTGIALVQHPGIHAVAFTGSQAGGMSLWRAANERETVIPVFAEMGTVNPAVVTPAGAVDMDAIAEGFVESFTRGGGQFCTKPGLIFVPGHLGAPKAIATALQGLAPRQVMLTRSIAESVFRGIGGLQNAGAEVIAQGPSSEGGWSAPAVLLEAPLSALRAGSQLLEECFGPVSIVAEYDDLDELLVAIGSLQGALAASVMVGDDDPDAARIVERLQHKVGRVVVNDWPTGVAFTWAQQHGGPWPSTTDPSATSVGASALDRFLRPVAYQGAPDELLPPALRASNPWSIPRRVNGEMKAGESS